MDNAELHALAIYGRVVMRLYFAWRATTRACDQALHHGVDDMAVLGHVEQLDVLLHQAELVTAPDHAAPVQRVLTAMFRSGCAYYHGLFDDTDEAVLAQLLRDYQEERTMVRTELDRLLGRVGQSP